MAAELILSHFQGIDIIIQHVESKPSKENPGQEFTFLLQCECFQNVKPQLEEKLKTVGATSITIKDHGTANNIHIWDKPVIFKPEHVTLSSLVSKE